MIIDEDAYLEHYGVKGMRWGVRKDPEEGSEVDAKTAEYIKAIPAPKKLSKKDAAVSLAENKAKFLKKAEPSDSSSGMANPKEGESDKGWRPTKKQVAVVAAGAAFVGLALYTHHKFDVAPGEPISPGVFKIKTAQTQMKTWVGENYLHESSFQQGEIRLPAGHVFHRISTKAEKGFRGTTYCTSSKDDFNRYVAAFRQEKGPLAQLHHVTFTAAEEIRIPSLTQRLDALEKVMSSSPTDNYFLKGSSDPKRVVIDAYRQMCGGEWNSRLASEFFSELGSQGFHGIVDDMDAGVIGDSPLVLFKASAFSEKTSKLLGANAIKEAEGSLLELLSRKAA